MISSVLNVPDCAVYCEEDHPPGREAQMDFTHCSKLGIIIGAVQSKRLTHLVADDAPLSPNPQTDTFASQIQHTSCLTPHSLEVFSIPLNVA